MLELVARKDAYIQDLVSHLDQRLFENDNSIEETKASLTTSEWQSIETEMARVSSPDPGSVRYFLENYFVINPKGEDEIQALQTISPLKESQEVLWADFELCWAKHIPVFWILLKARQIGWSTIVQALLFHRVIFNKHMNVLVIADELTRSQHIFDMSLLAYTYLPWWMRPEKQYDNRGKGILKFDRADSEERLVNPGLNSTFYIDAANKPSGSSRGFTLQGLHASEFGLFLRPKIVTSDILPALAKTNPLTVAAVEGTANEGQNQAYQDMWEMATKGRGLFRPMFAGWWKEKTYCKPLTYREDAEWQHTPEEAELIEKVKDECQYTISRSQMAWYREQADQFEATEGDRDRMEQEYPSFPRSAFRAAGICYFPRKKLNQIEIRDVKKPRWIGDIEFRLVDGKEKPVLVRYPDDMKAYAPLWVWEWPNSNDVYYEASDPSHGLPGKDQSTAQIFRVPRRTGERIRQCVEYCGCAVPRTLSKIVVTLGHMYNTCEMAPEMNTLTEHIGNVLSVHNYPKVYRWHRMDKITGRWTNAFGWETNSKSRNDISSRFRTFVIEDSIEIRSERLLDEARTFIEDAPGSNHYEAADGKHDDVLMAAMICVYCLMELDPRLFKTVEEKPVDTEKHDFQNTDHSLNDKEEEGMDTDFACL